MPSDINIVTTLDEVTWKEYVDRHSQGNIFHTPEMFHVFERARGYSPRLWAALNPGGEVLALFTPVQVTIKDGLMRRLTTRSIAYGGVLCNPDAAGREALALLLRKYHEGASQEALFTELRHANDPAELMPVLEQCGYTFEEHLDFLIDLNKPEAEVWGAIHKNARKAIRKFQNQGAAPEEMRDRSLLPVHYDLLRQTYQRANVPLADRSLFEAVFDVLVPCGMAKMLLARLEDRYIASSVELPYKDIIYSWYSGYDREARSVHANDGLVWYILGWGAANNYRYFDFGGAGRSDEAYSVRDFKAKFGGRLVNFGRHTCVHAPLTLAFSKVGYQVYRRLARA